MSEPILNRLDAGAADFDRRLEALLRFDAGSDALIQQRVVEIIDRVRREGDAALLELTARFDRFQATRVTDLELEPARLKAAWDGIPAEGKAALDTAATRIRAYAEHQKLQSWDFTDDLDNLLGQRVTPLDKVGLYVPGGKASYPSSVLMNAIPAKVAGVPEVVMVVPSPDGELNDLVLAAAHRAGVDRVFRLGGAQAVAALAYGTETVPRVDKIVGPGNIYVATAKKLVFGQVGIDMVAGPSEILVVSDGGTDPDWIAADLFSQAEHDEDAQAILLSPDAAHLDAVEASIRRLLPQMERREVIARSLAVRGALIRVASLEQAAAVVNRIAPEHLELSVEHPEALLAHIRNAGAIFLGRYTAEALGDYCAGPNHVLPTSGTARFSSPLGVYDFQKRSSLIRCSARGAGELGRVADLLARGEGLGAHALSARCRVR